MPILVTTKVYFLGVRVNKPGLNEVLYLKSISIREESQEMAISAALQITDLLLDTTSYYGSSVLASLFDSDHHIVWHQYESCRFPRHEFPRTERREKERRNSQAVYA